MLTASEMGKILSNMIRDYLVVYLDVRRLMPFRNASGYGGRFGMGKQTRGSAATGLQEGGENDDRGLMAIIRGSSTGARGKDGTAG
jgi:hypothetical protein